jgi:hypothetical protein
MPQSHCIKHYNKVPAFASAMPSTKPGTASALLSKKTGINEPPASPRMAALLRAPAAAADAGGV